MKIADQDILMSYNISSFFTKIPVDETIKIYRKYVLNITKTDLNDLLEVATKNKGPLIANVFMCHIKEKLENQKKMCAFYGCYADDTPCKMTDVSTASVF